MTFMNVKSALTKLACIVLLGQFILVSSAIARDKPDFTLPDMDGKKHSLSDYRGKWVLVNYWATWCPPCREELPDLEILHTQSEGKVVVLGVNVEDIELKPLRAFVEEQFLSFPILVATEQPTREQLIGAISGMPTSYLISPAGDIVARQVGPLTADIVRNFITSFEKDS